ncbi:MAG: cupin domain-containing protein [Pseudolabrys sp.]
MPVPLTFFFKDDGAVPNNPGLPMLVYKKALDLGADPESAIEQMFSRNGWGHGQWRNGIFPFAHYHSMIHEVLGIARGTARVRFGGANGEVHEVEPGDVAVLPAGTGHQRLSDSGGLVVIGGYPPQGTYNLCRGDTASDRDKAIKSIHAVPVPASDPVHGRDGPLLKLWHAGA